MSETPVQKIGRYEIEREIGRGGMAIVYKAHDPLLRRSVAIKLIKMSAFPQDAFDRVRARFELEARTLARLDHPHIIKAYDFGEWQGAPYLVMDYIQGSTLREIEMPVCVGKAVKLLTPVAEALEYIHSRGILHRDVKPSNIMITQRERVILTDFGIVKWLRKNGEFQTLTQTGFGVGTPAYMAPEQAVDHGEDARSDQYALSVVFYELITGHKPFTGKTPFEILTKQLFERPPDPRGFVPELSESVTRFFDRALAKKPDERYGAMGDYLRDMDGLRIETLRTVNRSSAPALSRSAAFPDGVNVGDILKFGRYPQRRDPSMGAEAIEWRVLEVEAGSALIVSVMGLDAKPYHAFGKGMTWRESTLRAWLNNAFYQSAFDMAERGMIELTHVFNEDNANYGVKGGEATWDYVFLLSIAEAEKYFKGNAERMMKPTSYAFAHGEMIPTSNGHGWWWLRSPGVNAFDAAEVSHQGEIVKHGASVKFIQLIRPAMRIRVGG